MITDRYNGWANRETWACHLHLTNDEGWYNLCRDMAKYAIKEQKEDGIVARHSLADDLKGLVEEMFNMVYYPEQREPAPPNVLGMAADVGSLWRVDWDEIARAFLEDE
jgi:hypothetical protein